LGGWLASSPGLVSSQGLVSGLGGKSPAKGGFEEDVRGVEDAVAPPPLYFYTFGSNFNLSPPPLVPSIFLH
jgi:hypothetical protein